MTFTPEVVRFLKAENERLGAGVDVDAIVRRIESGNLYGIWQRNPEDVAASIGTTLGLMRSGNTRSEWDPADIKDLRTGLFTSDTNSWTGAPPPHLGGAEPVIPEIVVMVDPAKTRDGYLTPEAAFDLGVRFQPPPTAPKQAVETGILYTAPKTNLSGLGTKSGSFALREATELAAHAEDASEPARDAFTTGEKVGQFIASPFTGGPSSGESDKADPLRMGLVTALGAPVGNYVRDEFTRGWEIAFARKDFTGREHDNSAQALGANIAAAATFTTGLLKGVTEETGKGAVNFFVEPVAEESRDYLAELEAARERRKEIYLPVGGIGPDDIRGGLRGPSLGSRVREFTRGVLPTQEEAAQENSGPYLGDPRLDADAPVREADGYRAQAERDQEAASHALPSLTPPLVPSPQLPTFTVPSPPSLPAAPVSLPAAEAPLNDARTAAVAGLGLGAVAVGASSLPGTPMSSALGSVTGAVLGAVDSAKSFAAANPTATTAMLGAAGAGAVLGGVAVTRSVSKRRSSKKKTAKKSSSSRRKSSGSRKKLTRKKSAKAKPAKKRRREDSTGVTRGKYRGQKVYRTKNGRPYVIRQSGPMKGMAKFIPQ